MTVKNRQFARKWNNWLAVLFFLLAGCGPLEMGPREEAFQLNLQQWQDDKSNISAEELGAAVNSYVVEKLPPLANGETPVLFVRGEMRTEENDSVMLLEGRFLYRETNQGVHIPVKVSILGSVGGHDEKKRERLVEGVIRDLRSGLVSNIRLCNGKPTQWIAALDSPEPDEQILAMALLQMHHVRSAAFRIVELLNDPRTEVGQAAAETAAILADETHANHIIQIAQRGGIEVEARCIQVLSQVGGPDAIAWLEMLALGHQNSQLRELSFNALKRLK